MHVDYIWAALRGLIGQKTSFPFEIIIFDDFSTDGTRDIINAFAKRYPLIVKTVLPDENQRSQGIKPLFDLVTPLCRGKYIACCDGDDYWSDTSKIQQQASFMEQNTEYVFSSHSISTINSNGELLDPDWLPDYYKKDFTEEEVTLVWSCVQLQSMMYRNVIMSIPDEMRKAPAGDVFFCSLLGHHGRSKYLPNIKPAMYRQHCGGEFSTLSMSGRHDHQSMIFYWLYRYYSRIGYTKEARVFKLRYLERGLREVSLIDIARLIYLRFRSSHAMRVLTVSSRS